MLYCSTVLILICQTLGFPPIFLSVFYSTVNCCLLESISMVITSTAAININRNFSGIHGAALLSTVSRSNWNLEMLVCVEGGKPEYSEKNPRSRDENQQQTQPRYDAETKLNEKGVDHKDNPAVFCMMLVYETSITFLSR